MKKKTTKAPRHQGRARGSSEQFILPAVAGRRLNCSNADFERRCLVMLGRAQEIPFIGSELIALLCDAVRCVREYSDAMQARNT